MVENNRVKAQWCIQQSTIHVMKAPPPAVSHELDQTESMRDEVLELLAKSRMNASAGPSGIHPIGHKGLRCLSVNSLCNFSLKLVSMPED